MQDTPSRNPLFADLSTLENPAVQQFIKLFQSILERSIQPDDDFFELGGDSIKAMQLVARANDLGLAIDVEDIFRRSTPAKLAQAATKNSAPKQFGQARLQTFPLTPAQIMFFDLALEVPDYFNQAQMFEALGHINSITLESAAQAVLAQHDALRLRFTKKEQGWVQQVAPVDHARLVQEVNVSSSTEIASWLLFRSGAEALHKSINLENGPVFRLLLANGFPSGKCFVLMVAHHLVVDGYSWRIILEDLEIAYRALEQGTKLLLPAPSAPYHEWSNFLTNYAAKTDFSDDLRYWLSREWNDTPVCRLSKSEPDSECMRFDHHRFLDPQTTRKVVAETSRTPNVDIVDVLLACAAQAAYGKGGSSELFVDVAHHGRIAPVAEAPDVSRTVGWFSTFFPICLKVSDEENLDLAAQAVRRQRVAIPNHGFTYGVMRHLVKKEYLPRRFAEIPKPSLLLTYAGQFSGTFSAAPLFRWVGAADASLPPNTDYDTLRGPIHHPLNTRMHEIVLAYQISHDQVMLRATFSNALHDGHKAGLFANQQMKSLASFVRA